MRRSSWPSYTTTRTWGWCSWRWNAPPDRSRRSSEAGAANERSSVSDPALPDALGVACVGAEESPHVHRRARRAARRRAATRPRCPCLWPAWDDEVDLDVRDPPWERAAPACEVPLRVARADPTELGAADGLDGVRRRGGARRSAHRRRRHDPERGRQGLHEALDGVPPPHADDQEGHRWRGPPGHRLARGARGPREV